MLSRDERVATLAAANRDRNQRKREAVETALQGLLRAKSKVSVSAVANAAGVSRNFVYAQKDLLEQVQNAAAGQPHRLHRPRPTSSTEASLRARLVATLDALDEAKQQIAALETKVERLTAELATQIAATA